MHGTAQARYDLLLAFPGERLQLDRDGAVRSNGEILSHHNFLDQLAARHAKERSPDPDTAEDANALPFSGGWFLFLGYELAREIEPGLKLPDAPDDMPVALAVRCTAALIRDHQTGQLHAVCEQGGDDDAAWTSLLEDAARAAGAPATGNASASFADWDEEADRHYLDSVRQIQRYVREGDVFQVNLSRQWRARCRSLPAPWQLYQQLRQRNPAPFAGLALLRDDLAIISSSPERLVQTRGRQVNTRPIAGTYPRLEQAQADLAQAQALLNHPKERAEHIMLIDLERNDLGRVCEPGSVKVSELMTVESYRHVHHIVSQVEGRLRADAGPVDVIRAVFPGGTITGCPKVRCMEIIAELERVGRGAYTGSMGYLNRNGDMDLNILIRTLVLQGSAVRFRAGAGIVADSMPERELAETRAKAAGLVRALGQELPGA